MSLFGNYFKGWKTNETSWLVTSPFYFNATNACIASSKRCALPNWKPNKGIKSVAVHFRNTWNNFVYLNIKSDDSISLSVTYILK